MAHPELEWCLPDPRSSPFSLTTEQLRGLVIQDKTLVLKVLSTFAAALIPPQGKG